MRTTPSFLCFAAGFACVLTASCSGRDPEKNIITNRAPFYKATLPYRDGSESAIVSAVKAFAKEHGMDYLGGPGHPTLDADQFNLTAAGGALNLSAVRVVTSLPNTEVFAIVRGRPNANDKALTAEFVRRLQQAGQREPGKNQKSDAS